MTSQATAPCVAFVVPAWNEALVIGECVRSIRVAADAAKRPYEVVVVDDSSDDGTDVAATAAGARVVRVEKRQIAAVRNAGAAATAAPWLVFVDADTTVSPELVAAAYAALDDGAVGGGARVTLDRMPTSWIVRVTTALFMFVWARLDMAAGCFVFCRRDAFDRVGGFDERYFATEETWFSEAMKAQGRFVVLTQSATTSARKLRQDSALSLIWTNLRILASGPRQWQRREGLEFWYDGRRGG
ncbi:MAG: glycosyltransferase [Planctomycetota bacterium]|nr:glycosyltransferase [Planctomycetota bacterium]MDA1106005.1 glycosyltransferase [Planctomycetota bacterium]